VRYSTRLFRVVPQELTRRCEEHASHNHNDGQNPEPRSHHGEISEMSWREQRRPEVSVNSRYLSNKMKTKVAEPKIRRDQEYSTHVLRHLTSADPVPRNFDYWPPMSNLRRLVRHTGTIYNGVFHHVKQAVIVREHVPKDRLIPTALATFPIVGKNEAACAAE